VSPSGVGQQLGDYRLEEIIGQGGMGVVYRATQLGLERTVAVKVIAPGLAADDTFRERFQREARMLAHVDHPHVIPIHHAGEADGQLFLSMRWVDGHDLAQEIRASPRGMEAERALLFLRQIGGALDAVHADGLIHRDIKPANVLIESRREGDHAYLTDFGAGRELDSPSEFTRTGQWLGTVDYIAPETLDGTSSGTSSDLYGLACVLFEMLAGAPPFRRDTRMATQLAHQYEPPPSIHARRPDLPLALDAVFARALSKNPDIRYASAARLAEAFADALVPAMASDTVTGETAVAPPPRAARQRGGARTTALASAARTRIGALRALPPRVLAVAGGALLVLVVAGVVLMSSGGDGGSPGDGRADDTRVVGVSLLERERAIDVQADQENAYVLDPENRAVIEIENLNLAAGTRFDTSGPPASMLLEADRDRIWVGLRNGMLVAIGRQSAQVVDGPLRLPFRPDRLEAFEDRIVAIGRKPGRAVLIDPVSVKRASKVAKLGANATGALGYGDVLLAVVDGQVQRYDTRLRLIDKFDVQDGSSGVLDLAGGVDNILWMTDAKAGTVLRVDPATGKRRAPPIKVGGHPQSLAIDPASVWVTIEDARDEDPQHTVARIDEKTGRVRGTSRVDYINGRLSTRGHRPGVYVVGSRPGTFDGLVLLNPASSR